MVAFGVGQRSSSNRLRSHEVFATTLAMPQYFSSALDLEMVPFRLDDQEMRFSPKKTQ